MLPFVFRFVVGKSVFGFSMCLCLCTLGVETVGLEQLALCACESPCQRIKYYNVYERATFAPKKTCKFHT